MPCETEHATPRMPTTADIAAHIAVRYVDQAGKPRKSTWGDVLSAFCKGVAFIAICALLFWWGWTLALPVVRQYTANPPALTFGRIFGAMLATRSLWSSVFRGTVDATTQIRLVK